VTTAPMPRVDSPRPEVRLWAGICVGFAAWLVSLALDPTRAFGGLLTAALFGVSLALGGLVFASIQVASGASWWWGLSEAPMRLARTLSIPLAALAVCLGLGVTTLYPWADVEVLARSPLVASKAAWLNIPLFLARAVVVVVVWLQFATAIDRRIGRLRREATPAARKSLVRAGIGFLIVYAFTSSIAMWDWSMSLEPEWFSTMRGVYGFAGTFLAGIAAVTVIAHVLDARGELGARLTGDQRHDLGKLLFGFSTFWAYIWFCEYMLIWYANMPEEAVHYATRLTGGWSTLFWLNPVLNFVVPFAVLLPTATKRHPPTLLQVALVVLLGRWLDAHLLVAPALGDPTVPVGAAAATLVVGCGMLLLGRRSGQAAA